MKISDIKLIQSTIAEKRINTTQLTGNYLITADYHNPCADLNMVEASMATVKQYKIKQMIIVGDYFNFDVLSVYSKKQGGDNRNPKLSDELNFGNKIFDYYSKWFTRIYYLLGNHEARFMKAVNNALEFSVIAEWLDQPKLRFINAYHCYLDNVRLTHPKSYSQIKLSTASRLCDKFNCDVIQAHGHFCSMGYSRGGHRAVDLGCMADWERIDYMTGADTTHPLWNKGFAVYHDKQIYVYGYGYGVVKEE